MCLHANRHDHGGGQRVRACHTGSHQPQDRHVPPCHFHFRDPAGVLRPRWPQQRAVHSPVYRGSRVSDGAQRATQEEVCAGDPDPAGPWPQGLHLQAAWLLFLELQSPTRMSPPTTTLLASRPQWRMPNSTSPDAIAPTPGRLNWRRLDPLADCQTGGLTPAAPLGAHDKVGPGQMAAVEAWPPSVCPRVSPHKHVQSPVLLGASVWWTFFNTIGCVCRVFTCACVFLCCRNMWVILVYRCCCWRGLSLLQPPAAARLGCFQSLQLGFKVVCSDVSDGPRVIVPLFHCNYRPFVWILLYFIVRCCCERRHRLCCHPQGASASQWKLWALWLFPPILKRNMTVLSL